jgi:hypothetical protein
MADDSSLPIDILDQSGRLIGQAQSALQSASAPTMQAAGKAIVAFLAQYRAPMLANTDTAGEVDQLDTAQSQLSDAWIALGGATGTPGEANLAGTPFDNGTPSAGSPTGSFLSSLSDTAQSGLQKTADGIGKLINGGAAAAQATVDSIKTILVILAVGLSVALIVFGFVYAGGEA